MSEDLERKPMLDQAEESEEPSLIATRVSISGRRFEQARLSIEFGLVLAVIILSLLFLKFPTTARDLSLAPGPHPQFQLKNVVFMPDARYVSDETFGSKASLRMSLRNWLDLTTYGRGIIDVETPGRYTTDPPLVSSHTDSAYMISVFHQLHCLSHIMQAYGELHLGLQAPGNPAFAEHTAHCFDYLRQSIMCNADVTLQGNSTEGFTWGTSHVCRDFGAIQDWGNDMASAVKNDSQTL